MVMGASSSGFITVELYRQARGTDVIKAAHCRIPLKGLLSGAQYPKVKGTAKLISADIPFNKLVGLIQ